MRFILTILLTLISFVAFTQEGDPLNNAVKHNYKTSEWGTQWGVLKKPAGTGKHPTIIFFHGVGEAGSGSSDASLGKLSTWGIFKLVKDSGWNGIVTNPVNGVTDTFMLIALQDGFFSPEIDKIWYALKNDDTIKNRIDWNRVYLTGLSAGGQNLLNGVCSSQNYADSIKAVVPMSTAAWTVRPSTSTFTYPKAWGFHGESDGTAPFENTRDFCDSANGRWTHIPTTHSNWNSSNGTAPYDLTYREIYTGYNLNIYEWMLVAASGFPSGPCPGDSSVKVPVRQIINSTLTGNKWALFDEQDKNVQSGCFSDPLIYPANSTYASNNVSYDTNHALICRYENPTGRFRNKALPTSGLTYDIRFDGVWHITKICIFTEAVNANKFLTIKSGTPFNFNQTIDSLLSADLSVGGWTDLTVNDTTRWMQLHAADSLGIINEIVVYGYRIGVADTEPTITKVKPQRILDSIMATNIFYGMGRSADGNYYNYHWTGGLRSFSAAAYLQYANGNLKHPAGVADALEYNYDKVQLDSGSNLHFAFGSIVDSSMMIGAGSNNPGGDWADMKPIPTNLADTSTWQAFSYQDNLVRSGLPSGNGNSTPSSRYILTFNEIAEIPASYKKAARNLRKYANGGKLIGLYTIEPDNEKDGTFKKAGYMLPYSMAAMMSAYYDGHRGTIWDGADSVGVWGTGVKLIFPALSYTFPDYIEAMTYWWRYNRDTTGGWKQYPFDIFNVHQYPGTLAVQFSGSGKAISPENTYYNLQQKLDTALHFAAIYETPLVNTELGFDAYIDTNKRNNSFQAIHAFGTKNVEQIQADWIARSYLMHAANGVTMYQYWLADQGNYETTGGTFNATGLLKWNTDDGALPFLQKRPAYYWMKTLKARLGSYTFKSQTIDADTLYKQLYVNGSDSAYVIWYGTEHEKSSLKVVGNFATYNLISMVEGDEDGSSTTGTGTLNAVMDETPKIIYFTTGDIVVPPTPQCTILRTRKKFVNAP